MRAEDRAWMVSAACAGVDPDVFHPYAGQPANEAHALCNRCPVRLVCLEYALTTPEKHGIWGGLSERSRRRIRHARRQVA